MVEKNIITANLSSARFCITEEAMQYDYGQVLMIEGVELPESYEVQFSNHEYNGETVSQIGGADGVSIPDELLTVNMDVYAFVFLHEGADDGETEYKIRIPVKARPKPSDIEPTPVQHDIITEAIAALNAGIATAEEAVTQAETAVVRAGEAVTLAETQAERAERAAETAAEYGQRISVSGTALVISEREGD